MGVAPGGTSPAKPGPGHRPSDAGQWGIRHANEEVRQWLEDAWNDTPVDFESNIGFVKIALTNAFQHLRRGSSFEDAIRETLLGGGDTDTNAAIVVGLVGAASGADRARIQRHREQRAPEPASWRRPDMRSLLPPRSALSGGGLGRPAPSIRWGALTDRRDRSVPVLFPAAACCERVANRCREDCRASFQIRRSAAASIRRRIFGAVQE